MAAEKRKMSTKAKVITGLIYLLALVLLGTVIYLNLNPDMLDSLPGGSESTTAAGESTTLELPYSTQGSDRYANIENPAYKVGEVNLKQDENRQLCAYVDGKKVDDYTGVAQAAEGGWFFVRDGVVDFHYTGIAGNELGNWYVKEGIVDFYYSGEYTVNNNTYTIDGGKATLKK